MVMLTCSKVGERSSILMNSLYHQKCQDSPSSVNLRSKKHLIFIKLFEGKDIGVHIAIIIRVAIFLLIFDIIYDNFYLDVFQPEIMHPYHMIKSKSTSCVLGRGQGIHITCF